jgi:hypothetical protein
MHSNRTTAFTAIQLDESKKFQRDFRDSGSLILSKNSALQIVLHDACPRSGKNISEAESFEMPILSHCLCPAISSSHVIRYS